MKIIVPQPITKSRSRKVNGYVRAVLVLDALRHAEQLAKNDVNTRLRALTGGQLAEAERILAASH